MKVLGVEQKFCICCMETHDVKTVSVLNHTVFKGVPVEYEAEYFFCELANETYADERQLVANDIAMKNAYRKKVGLLTSGQISAIRTKYGMSQNDLCLLLGWGAKTITRYESHQVQDVAHDTILRKLDSDPEWFLQLLQERKTSFPVASYERYAALGARLFENGHDAYLKRAIMSLYAKYAHDDDATGGRPLSLDVVADMIRYYANSTSVKNLFLVKLMKLLWYADALSYKRRGHSISGLVYRALPMGAVPVAYELIVDLNSVNKEEIDIDDGTAYRFSRTGNNEFLRLTTEDKEILDSVIQKLGSLSKNEIVEYMHREDAYAKTAPKDVIRFQYTKTLTLE